MSLPHWIPQRSPADQSIAVLRNFIFHTKVPVTTSSIEYAVVQYPSYPYLSLDEYGHLLKSWGVETLCTNLKLSSLAELRYPVISYISSDERCFILIYGTVDYQITYIHPRLGWIQESVEEFASKWQGRVLIAIPTKGCGEVDFEQKKADELTLLQDKQVHNHIRTITQFLSAEECKHLIAMSEPLFARSQVVNSESPDSHRGRSSSTAMLEKSHDAVLLDIYNRSAELLELPVNNLEYGQCVSYQKGQEYQAHFDTLDESTQFGQKVIAKYGQRAITLLVYLNDDFEGGETYFPHLDYKIRPQAGMAVIFRNLNRDGKINQASLHAGLPVFSGRKFALNLWGWTKAFR